MAWQKRARFAVAVFGIVCAAVVYAALGERRVASPPPPVDRLDPKAIAESKDGRLKQLRESEEDFNVTFERQLTYENGRSKSFGVHIAAKERGGERDFHVNADEAEAGDNQQVLRLAGHVRLDASDGFTLATDRATFTQADGVVHSDGTVTFGKGRMSGYGSDTTYNQKSDVLAIAKDAHIEMRNERDVLTLNFDAGAATLDRMQDLLTLDGMVHVVRDQQIIEADHAVAHLDSEDQFITLLELRGSARVQGTGGELDAMSARDIDLHYTADGKMLERVILTGGSAIALTGENGAPGRSVTGESLDAQLAPDGSVTHLTANDANSVRLQLPAAEGTPSRSITAKTLDATGTPGKGLTTARFVDAVEFREEAQKDTPARTVRARTLDAALTASSVSEAVFAGAVRFDEQSLSAGAAELRYQPDEGTLKLTGSDAGGGPHVADERITIDAQKIDVTLQGRHMTATTAVKTMLKPAGAAKNSDKTTAAAPMSEPNRLPGLLKQDKPASVNASTLEYDGAAGKATYTGTATLTQGDTALRADTITLDEQKGDLVATGNATLRLALENGDSVGQAHEIRYDDERHLVTYLPSPASAARQAATPAQAAQSGRAGATATRPSQPHLNGPQGDLRADRVELFLAEGESALDRLEAYDSVTMAVDKGMPTQRTATGARLTYRATREEYEMAGTATAPVKVVESCRTSTGKTLTFYKSADRIVVDGKNEIRTETKSSGSCSQSAPPAPTRP